MIFSGGLHELVLDGRKTVTRRPFDPERPCPYAEGRDYTVQPGRGKRSQGRIIVTSVRDEPLQAITDEDAVLEGFADRAAFFRKWLDLYGTFAGHARVWRIEFEVKS